LSSIATDSLPLTVERAPSAWQNRSPGQTKERESAPELFIAPSGRELRIRISNLDDLVKARRSGRSLAMETGFSGSRVALVLTAISELARNILKYARSGEILISQIDQRDRKSIVVIAADQGPGINDLSAVLNQSATAQSYRGLNGLKSCMDDFRIESRPGLGTQVTCEVRAR
jgi:serine/threonine-protein kinase RsbT